MTFIVKPTDESVPETQERAVYSGSDWKEGALVLVHSDGTFKECGADPASIAGVARSDVGTGSGAEYPIGSKEFPPGYCQAVLLKPGMKLTAEYTGTMGTVGTAYGVVRGSDGKWRIDFTETGTAQFKLVRDLSAAPLDSNRVEVVVVTSFIQAA